MNILMFVLGAIFGSFFFVVGSRMPLKENITSSRSRCDHCKKELKFYDMIPVLSFLLLKGKCRYCKKNIDVAHFLVEIFSGLIFMYIYISFSFGYEFYMSLILASLFIVICVSDFKYFIILDEALIFSSILIIILQLIFLDLNIFIYNILSGIGLFVFMLIVRKIGDLLFKKESLGGGDIKLAFVIGLAIGFNLSMFALMLSAFLALPTSLASVIISKNKEVPFGPFLSGALLIVFVFADKFNALISFITNL